MNTIGASPETVVTTPLHRAVFQGDEPTALANIYLDEANIAIWNRQLTSELTRAADDIVSTQPKLQASARVTSETVRDFVNRVFGADQGVVALNDDVVQIVDMFSCLFELKYVGIRIAVLDRAMCPRFHADRVTCRLVTTYQGIATEWLHHDVLDRSKLGAGNQGKPDEESGLFKSMNDIQYLNSGDVALLKGEAWEGNENAGLVHRSPQLNDGQSRLIMTLDFAQ